jgi:hypothetical protein
VADVCDGSQDAFVVRVHTDAGIIGLGEADSMPSVLKAVFEAPTSNSIGHGLRDVLLGQDPLQPEPLWQRMYDQTLYLGGAGVRLTAAERLRREGYTAMKFGWGGFGADSVSANADLMLMRNHNDLRCVGDQRPQEPHGRTGQSGAYQQCPDCS